MVAIIEGRDLSTVEDAYASTLAHEQGFRPSQPEVIEPAAKKVHMISEKIEAPEAPPTLRRRPTAQTTPPSRKRRVTSPPSRSRTPIPKHPNNRTGARNRAPVLKNITLKGALFMIRLASEQDLPAIAAIYEAILDHEDATGLHYTGWQRGAYPHAGHLPRAF